MRGYGQFCPVAKASEVFAERWTPLILRELFDGQHRFSEIHAGVPAMSRSLLAQRLRSLESDGVIERRELPGGRGPQYYLTPAGSEFGEILQLLGTWGRRWVSELHAEELNLELLMIGMTRRVRPEQLPKHRVVMQFEFPDARHVRYWMVFERPEVELCYKDPGYEPNLFVTTDTRTLIEVHLGTLTLARSVAEGRITLDGPRWAKRGFTDWIGPHPTLEWERKWGARLEAAHAATPA